MLLEKNQEIIPDEDNHINRISLNTLGDEDFQRDYNVKYNYVCGSMYKGISSENMVVALAKQRILSFFGSGGLDADEVEKAIINIKSRIRENHPFGVNLLSVPGQSDAEMKLVDLCIKHQVRVIEASAFMQISLPLVRYHVSGLVKGRDGKIKLNHRIISKVSRPEVAELFMKPPPEKMLSKLVEQKFITREQAMLATSLPISQDICVESDSAGHTDQGNPFVLLPSILSIRDNIARNYNYLRKIRIGAAGGIGTPEAAFAAFMLGADFILTGSVNQCTVESGMSSQAKDILQHIQPQDTGYAPAGDMFGTGAQVQVVKRGLFFHARANKLQDIYFHNNSLDELDDRIKQEIEHKYFGRKFDEVWEETRSYYQSRDPATLLELEKSPKKKMAALFKWYFIHSTRLALAGSNHQKMDYQLHCGPALGAFNMIVKGQRLESWKNRHVSEVADFIMSGVVELLADKLSYYRYCNADFQSKKTR